MIEIYQKKRKRPKKLLYRQNYHILRQLGRIPTRYTPYCDLSADERARQSAGNVKRMRVRLDTDPAFRKAHYHASHARKQRKAGNAKVCSKCGVYTAFIDFDRRNTNATKRGTLRPDCRKCRKLYNKEYYARIHQK